MAQNIGTQGEESLSIVNMKPSGGGVEEINALWGQKIAANFGYILSQRRVIGVSSGTQVAILNGDSAAIRLRLPGAGLVMSKTYSTTTSKVDSELAIDLTLESEDSYVIGTLECDIFDIYNASVEGVSHFPIYRAGWNQKCDVYFEVGFTPGSSDVEGEAWVSNFNVFGYGG